MIQNLKDLKNLFKLCRAQGVTEFVMEGFSIKFGDLPNEQRSSAVEEELEDVSDEKLMYWSTPQGQEELDKKVGLA